MQIRNTKYHFGIVAISFHWLMAILIIGMLALGLYMKGLPTSLEKLKLYGWHKELGLLILWLVILRLAWRITNIIPELALPLWEKLAARATHWIFYGFMFALPISGWLMTSAAGLQPSFFGLFVLPSLMPANDAWLHIFKETHEFLAYSLIAIILLHVCAALKHHFIDKDDILRRMFP